MKEETKATISTHQDSQKERPFTFQEASEYLRISKSYLYKLTSTKQILHYKPNGKLIYFIKDDLDDWIMQNQIKDCEVRI